MKNVKIHILPDNDLLISPIMQRGKDSILKH